MDLMLPTDRLQRGELSVPAILAGLTATGDFQELEFVDHQIAGGGVYPRKAGKGDVVDEPEEQPTETKPPMVQSLDEVRALLGSPAPGSSAPSTPSVAAAPNAGPSFLAPPAAAQPTHEPPLQPGSTGPTSPFQATMPSSQAVELATQLALNNPDTPNVLAGWQATLDQHGRGLLRGGAVRCEPTTGTGYTVTVQLVPAGRGGVDQAAALDYADAVVAALGSQFGPPPATWESDSLESWGWKVGMIGLVVDASASGVVLGVTPNGDGLLTLVRSAGQPPPAFI